jgi:hypothetical protein
MTVFTRSGKKAKKSQQTPNNTKKITKRNTMGAFVDKEFIVRRDQHTLKTSHSNKPPVQQSTLKHFIKRFFAPAAPAAPVTTPPPQGLFVKIVRQLHDPSLRKEMSPMVRNLRLCNETVAVNSGSFNFICNATLVENPARHVIVRKSKRPVDINDTRARRILLQSVNNAIYMSDERIGPNVHDILYTPDRHVLFVMDRYDNSLHEYLWDLRNANLSAVQLNPILQRARTLTLTILYKMDHPGLVCLDIKPENTVINYDSTTFAIKDLRFIDTDQDMCENWESNHDITLDISNNMYTILLFAAHLARYQMNYLEEDVRGIIGH